MQRRSFLQAVAAGAGSTSCGVWAAPTPAALDDPTDVVVAGMPHRVLGRTGQRISIIGYAGFALREGTQADCTDSLRQALEQGINYFDVAPAYADGVCEERMGQAFAEIDGFRRESIFLSCKTKLRTRAGAQEELERSLRRLRTDYFDLYQLHCLIKPDEDVEQSLGAGGAMETILRAREQGKVRHIGFSAHTTRAALLALQKFPFDTVMFPVNYVEHFVFGFGQKVLDLAAEQGAAVLAIKPMSGGDWPAEMTWEKRPRKWWYRTLEDQDEISLAFRFTLSQRAVVSGIPPAWLDLAPKAWEAGRQFRPITDEELARLRGMAQSVGAVFQSGELAMRGRVPSPHPRHGPHEQCPGMMS
ncbi:MAG: aldo/keto reductase [Pirellulaceae bacterium]|jgi:aryl-alcohol dehydrogenase-like predicted oxidoreductase|nr:aldo/keto reductase [Pirellulaceae bacterium]